MKLWTINVVWLWHLKGITFMIRFCPVYIITLSKDSSRVIIRYCHKIACKMFCELTKCCEIILAPKIVLKLSYDWLWIGPQDAKLQMYIRRWTEDSKNDDTNHERKNDWDLFDSFYDPETNETDDLNGGEEVNTPEWDVTQVHVVRLVLGRHKHDQHALYKLKQHTHHTQCIHTHTYSMYTQHTEHIGFCVGTVVVLDIHQRHR